MAPEITIRTIDPHLADRIVLECLEVTDQEGDLDFSAVVPGHPWREAYGCVAESLSPHICEVFSRSFVLAEYFILGLL